MEPTEFVAEDAVGSSLLPGDWVAYVRRSSSAIHIEQRKLAAVEGPGVGRLYKRNHERNGVVSQATVQLCHLIRLRLYQENT